MKVISCSNIIFDRQLVLAMGPPQPAACAHLPYRHPLNSIALSLLIAMVGNNAVIQYQQAPPEMPSLHWPERVDESSRFQIASDCANEVTSYGFIRSLLINPKSPNVLISPPNVFFDWAYKHVNPIKKILAPFVAVWLLNPTYGTPNVQLLSSKVDFTPYFRILLSKRLVSIPTLGIPSYVGANISQPHLKFTFA